MSRETLYWMLAMAEFVALLPVMYFFHRWLDRRFGPQISPGGPLLIVMIAVVVQITWVAPMFR